MLSLFSETLPARPVRLIRMVIGAICLLRSVEGYRLMSRVLNPLSMRFPVWDALPAFNRTQALILLSLWVIAAIAFTLGWRTGITGLILAAAMGIPLVLDQQLYSSHLYLLCLIVLLLTLAEIGRPAQSSSVWRWPILLLQLQLSIVYFFAAITKMNSVYLGGYMLGANLRRNMPAIAFNPRLLSAMAVASIVVELFLAGAFWVPRLRKTAVVIGLLFHMAMIATLVPEVAAQLAIFAAACIAIYPFYFLRAENAPAPNPSTDLTPDKAVEIG
ncbi:MAG TPA: HTTM domain-containing protein [Pyrinomonadaceae bacterium]|nr:HTTM domain-containing protein [Pyrinomonadaceae bacterium]